MPLLLFDIDGTLLDRATDDHRDAVLTAIQEVYGIGDVSGVRVDTAGRTDPEIARMLLLGAGVPAVRIDDGLPEFRSVCARHYAQAPQNDLGHHVLPGVPELLAWLAERGDVTFGLVTGNLEAIARVKLKRAGLSEHFAHAPGGFGSDSEDRTSLPGIARRRAGADGSPYPREETWVIGDTPRDIACALADGVHCVGVATGRFETRDLYGADHAVANAAALKVLLEQVL